MENGRKLRLSYSDTARIAQRYVPSRFPNLACALGDGIWRQGLFLLSNLAARNSRTVVR